MDLLTPINEKLYVTAEAYIVTGPVDMPRELASEMPMDTKTLNQSYLWVAGRYVQANKANKNGHYWTFDDLQKGQSSIQYVPVNALHDWNTAIGTIVQSKIVHREEKIGGEKASERLIPEIQVLGLVWAANFPDVADKVREANENKQLWWSMECVAESTQCLNCEQIFPYAMAATQTCVHLASSAVAPRRFINPTFLGGALIFPPEKPAWPDAEAQLARELISYASRSSHSNEVEEWQQLMELVTTKSPVT